MNGASSRLLHACEQACASPRTRQSPSWRCETCRERASLLPTAAFTPPSPFPPLAVRRRFWAPIWPPWPAAATPPRRADPRGRGRLVSRSSLVNRYLIINQQAAEGGRGRCGLRPSTGCLRGLGRCCLTPRRRRSLARREIEPRDGGDMAEIWGDMAAVFSEAPLLRWACWRKPLLREFANVARPLGVRTSSARC